MKSYKALLFSPDGESVTDFRDKKAIPEVWDCINNMGARWIFYPIAFVSTDKTIVDAPEGMDFLIGKRIETVKKYLSEKWHENKEQICEALNEGYPLHFLYN